MSSMSNQQNNNNNNNNQNKGNYSIVGVWLRRFSESYLGAWLLDWFQASSQAMASAAASAGPTPTPSSGGGPLSFMGCMREASPPPYDDQPPPQQHHHHRPVGLPTGEYGASQIGNHGFESMPKEPKKRRFHPLRGLRRIFRKKSRGAADARISGATNGEREPSDDRHHHVGLRDREEVTLRDPAGRADEIRSRSASELLTDSCDRERLFVRRRGIEESFANLQRGSGQLSVSHDSVFPGEVTHARPLSSLDMHASLERRTAKASNNETNHKDSHTAQRHRISLRVLEQIKTVIENRNQIAAASSTTTAGTTTAAAAATTASTTTATTESTNSLHNRFGNRERSSAATTEDIQAKVPRKDAPTPPSCSTTELSSSPLKEDLPDLTTASLNHTAAKHRIMVRPKNRRPPRRSTSQTNNNNNNNGNSNNNNNSSNNNNMNNSNSNNNNINNNNNNNTSISSSNSALPRIDSISENSIDTLDSLEAIVPADDSMGSIELTQPESPIPQQQQPQPQQQQQQPQVTKPIPILRKSSSRLSRNSEVFEELETKLPVLRKPAVSPDSLESNLDSRSATDVLDIIDDVKVAIPKPLPRTTSTSSDGYEKSNTALSSPKRRSSSNRLSKSPDSLESTSPGWFTKSNEGFDKLLDFERENNNSNINNSQKPVAATRRLLLNPISKSQERVCCSKSSDSLEALEALNSDDSMERRRSSFEIRPRRNQVHKVMSKSTECFESTLVEHQEHIIKADEKRKRASVSEMNLSRRSSGSSSRHSKLLSKSSESFEKISNLVEAHQENNAVMELEKVNMWRGNRRVAHSSESSDNLDLDDNCKLENRNKARRSTPKRLSSGNGNNFLSDEHENVLMRKPSRLQKNSESSELGSTDTLDSERRNTMKSSDSDETLDSLEKDLQEQSQPEQDRKDEETTESVLDKREKNSEDEDEKVGSYWRRRLNSQESKDKDSNNLDIHQLLAYTLVSRIQENGNNDDHNDEENNREEDKTSKTICSTSPVVVYPKKKQHQQQTQQQSSSDDKILNSTISNLLSSKTDEDLQNMLNGNISEVSTDTKSFKEKLIMFEKLGK